MKVYLLAAATACTLLTGCVSVPYDEPPGRTYGGVYSDPYPNVYGYGYEYGYPVYPAPRAYPYYDHPQRGYPYYGHPHDHQRGYPADRPRPRRDVQRPPPAAQGPGNAEVYQRNRDRNSDGAPTWRAPAPSVPQPRAVAPAPVQPEVYQRNRDRDSDGSPSWGPPAR